MSEQNILNPSQTSLFNPDWGYTEGLPEMRSLFQAMSGKTYSRRQMVRGRVYDLAWNNRDLATKHSLQQWAQQYENDFFSLADWERSRYFSGRFDGPLTFNPVGNQKYNIRGRFVELPGLPMFSYPSNWSRDAIFLEERNGFGEDLVKLTPAVDFSYRTDALGQHGTACYNCSSIGDFAEWVYFGYGFRFWAPMSSDRGKVDIYMDGVFWTTVDQYAAAGQNSSALAANATFSLAMHRVKCVIAAKNVLSSANNVLIDAIEVMQ